VRLVAGQTATVKVLAGAKAVAAAAPTTNQRS
jgi:hypothetical protein